MSYLCVHVRLDTHLPASALHSRNYNIVGGVGFRDWGMPIAFYNSDDVNVAAFLVFQTNEAGVL